ncbi:hypothetical protein, partial [endosymbiont of Ridgeia piscesae]
MYERLFQWVLTNKYLVVLLTLLSLLLLGAGVRQLEFSNDYRMFFSEDNPQLQAFEKLQNT